MANKKTLNLKPGHKAPASGQYSEVGPRGGHRGEITAVREKKLPPTREKGNLYRLVDPTKNKSGKP